MPPALQTSSRSQYAPETLRTNNIADGPDFAKVVAIKSRLAQGAAVFQPRKLSGLEDVTPAARSKKVKEKNNQMVDICALFAF
jgi:hypothetical protein